ncbi:hypothetical protein AB0M20_13160, partial [Actinoplanes sp. NPDC051633]|uniref:hypothetical protein n=1 Tax=Actinoplanes sp. NPDC051633 TaxID=3155670 RepID=UPI003433C14E
DSLLVQVLTDGQPETEQLERHVVHHLLDTRIEFRDRRATSRDVFLKSQFWTLAGALAGVISLVIAIMTVIFSSSSEISISLSPDSGPAGTQAVLSGEGAERFSVVVVRVSAASVAEVPASPAPSSSTIPTKSNSSSPPPSSTSAGTTYNPSIVEIGRTQADQEGKFQAAITIPGEAEKGALRIDVSIQESGSTSFEYLTFLVR